MFDLPALLAIAALGWGLSLATYRYFARRSGWPMGSLHVDLPAVPTVVGLSSIFLALAFASWRGVDQGGVIIVVFGVLLAIFWTGFLRVGSQITLVLAPFAMAGLIFVWLALLPSGLRAGPIPAVIGYAFV